MANTTKIARCAWASGSKTTPLMMTYHDLEWGHPLKDNDSLLFELLTLEIFQAGLSWEIVLKKRHHLKKPFGRLISNLWQKWVMMMFIGCARMLISFVTSKKF